MVIIYEFIEILNKIKDKFIISTGVSKLPLFEPFSYSLIIWNFIHILIILHNLILFPITKVFGNDGLILEC